MCCRAAEPSGSPRGAAGKPQVRLPLTRYSGRGLRTQVSSPPARGSRRWVHRSHHRAQKAGLGGSREAGWSWDWPGPLYSFPPGASSEDTPGDIAHSRQALAFRAARKPPPRGHRQGPGPDTATPVLSLEETVTRRGRRRQEILPPHPLSTAEPAFQGLASAHPPGKASVSIDTEIQQQQLEIHN